MIKLDYSSSNLKKIEDAPSKQKDFMAIWRDSSLRRVYKKYFKKYVVVQSFITFFWRIVVPVCYRHFKILKVSLINAKETKWRPLIKLCEYVDHKNLQTYKLEDEIIVEPTETVVFPFADKDYFLSSEIYTKFPEVYVATIKKGTIYGDSNFIFVEEDVICHDLYDFKKDYSNEELRCRAIINPKLNNIRWLVHDEKPDRISAAAAFVDANALNYAHWLSEVLPRVILFCSDERFKNIPIVVNDGLHKNIMESLLIAVGYDREVFFLPVGKALCCDQLYVVSATGYVPFDWRNRKIVNPSHGLFHANALNNLRLQYINIESVSENIVWPDKIFISRNSGTRKCTNSDEIEKQLSKRGYTTVHPEKLSFMEQVEIFKNATTIIAPTGAGLANAIFCKPGASLGILMARHERMIYRYWTNMLACRRLKIFYVLGDIIKNNKFGIHGDFAVNQHDFIRFIEAIEGNDV